MKEVLNELDAAYKLISSVPVRGDAIDIIAEARARLRKAYTELENKEGEVEE